MHYRTFPKFKLAGSHVEYGNTENVTGERIGSKLYPSERSFYAVRQCPGKLCFPDSRNVLYKQVSPRQQADDDILHHFFFTDKVFVYLFS